MMRPYHPVDKAVKRLFHQYPPALLRLARIPVPAHPIQVEDSGVLASDLRADFVCLLPNAQGARKSVLVVEFQLIPKLSELRTWFRKALLLQSRYQLPTAVLVVYLTQGKYRTFPDRYTEQAGVTNVHILQKVHLWEELDRIRSGELWELLPLLILCVESPPIAVTEETIDRIKALPISVKERVELLDIAYEVNLRYFPRRALDKLFKREFQVAKQRTIIDEWREEATSQGLSQGLSQGRVEEARRTIQSLGGRRFGPPTPEVEAALLALTSPEELQPLVDRLLEVESWSELLA